MLDLNTYSFVIAPANVVTASINHDRCLLRTTDEFEQWMSGTSEEAYSLVRTPDPEIMHIVQSGMEKADVLGQ
ncbi:hypothetical protein ACO2I3_18940 [Leptospira interrogans]